MLSQSATLPLIVFNRLEHLEGNEPLNNNNNNNNNQRACGFFRSIYRSSHQRWKEEKRRRKVFFEISQNSQENTWASVSFLIKLQAWGLQTTASIFLWKKFLTVESQKLLSLKCIMKALKNSLLRICLWTYTTKLTLNQYFMNNYPERKVSRLHSF